MNKEMHLNIKKLPLKDIFSSVINYISKRTDELVFASIINFAFLGIYGIFVHTTSSSLFLPWICAYYAFWFAFFRHHYNKKPILFTKKIFGTLVPSTKILFIMFILGVIIVLLPFVPLFMGYNDEYAIFIDKYMASIQTISNEGNNNTGTSSLAVFYLLVLLLSPIIFIRPMFAWISSLIGRSGSIRNAFNNSKNNYFRLLVLAFVFEVPIALLEILFVSQQWNGTVFYLFSSPLMVLGNVSIAKSYDFFFLSSDNL